MSIGPPHNSNGDPSNPAEGARPRGRPRSQAKDEAILRAAADLFLERGLEGASLDAVAERAGVSKPTIYARFAHKDDLFRAAIGATCDQILMDGSFPDADPRGDLKSGLIGIATAFLGLITSPDALALERVIMRESPRHPRIAELFFEVAVGSVKQKVCAWISHQAAAGRLSVPDVEGAAWRFLGSVKAEAHMRAALGLSPQPAPLLKAHIDACAADFLRLYGPSAVDRGSASSGSV